MSYTYGLHGAPAIGGGLPGLPQRSRGEASRGGLVKVSLDAFSGVPYGMQVAREDFPALSAALPPSMLCQAYGCQAIVPAVVTKVVKPSWSDDGKYLIGVDSIYAVVDDTLTSVSAVTTQTNASSSIDAVGETFACTSSVSSSSLNLTIRRSGSFFTENLSVGSGNAIQDVSVRPDGLSVVCATASSTGLLLQEFKRANKLAPWSGPTSIGVTGFNGTCRAAQFDRVNGEYLAAVKASGSGLELYRLMGGVYTLVSTLPATYPGEVRVAWSPDGTKVAVMRTTQVFVMERVGDTLTRLNVRNFSEIYVGLSVTWHDNKTLIFSGEVVNGTQYEHKVHALDTSADVDLLLSKSVPKPGNTGSGGVASSGTHIAVCKDLTLDVRGSTKQVIASLAQPDIYIG